MKIRFGLGDGPIINQLVEQELASDLYGPSPPSLPFEELEFSK
jgi:hypothetical protein